MIALQETTLLLEHFDLHFSTLLPTRVEGLSFRARSPKFIPSPKSLCRSIHQQPPLDASKYGDRLKSGGAVVCLNAISCCALVNFIMWGFGGRRRAVVEEQETRARPAAAAVCCAAYGAAHTFIAFSPPSRIFMVIFALSRVFVLLVSHQRSARLVSCWSTGGGVLFVFARCSVQMEKACCPSRCDMRLGAALCWLPAIIRQGARHLELYRRIPEIDEGEIS